MGVGGWLFKREPIRLNDINVTSYLDMGSLTLIGLLCKVHGFDAKILITKSLKYLGLGYIIYDSYFHFLQVSVVRYFSLIVR